MLPSCVPSMRSSMTRWPPESRTAMTMRSEEHTSELQSLAYLVCRLLLEKKKKTIHRKSTRLNARHYLLSYADFCLKKLILLSAAQTPVTSLPRTGHHQLDTESP